jgi:hypothetical protein
MNAFSAKSMALFEDAGTGLGGRPTVFLITSPNCYSCPIVRSAHQQVRAREDGRYYAEDFTSYPQLFTEMFGYNSVTPRRPSDPNNPLLQLWWVPKEEDHKVDCGSIFTGLGTLAPQHLERFTNLQNQLTDCAKRYQEKHRLSHSLMHSLERSLRQCLERLSSLPCTFKDLVGQVAEFQRVYLDLLSWLDFEELFGPRWSSPPGNSSDIEADSSRMGAYTTQPDTVQWLYAAGIPVWYVRQVESAEKAREQYKDVPVNFFKPDSSSKDWMNGNERDPFPIIYVGPAGDRRQTVVKRMGSFLANVADLSGDPVLQIPESGPTRSTKGHERLAPCKLIWNILHKTIFQVFVDSTKAATQPVKQGVSRKSSGRDKFVEPIHVSMPPSIETWVKALQSVDQDPHRIKNSAASHKGYRFPDPGLFLFSSQKEVYLATWLSSRSAWMMGMAKDIWPGDGAPSVSSQFWRDFLHRGCFPPTSNPTTSSQAHQPHGTPTATSKPTKAQRRNQEVTKIFHHHMRTDLKEVDCVFWKQRRLVQGDFANLEQDVVAEILWDLYEHNWRLDLLTLDLIVSPSLWQGENGYARDDLVKSLFHNSHYLVITFPTFNHGLASKSWKDRAPYVKILRDILSSWPGFQDAVRRRQLTTPVDVSLVEQYLADFYCQTFYDYFGRVPITPHRLPCVD